ncbi:MAG: hypothetical protein FWG12_02075 [Holophagaceae bacterium]|nr:hypothetical protein [Holophagaceae bacterium]
MTIFDSLLDRITVFAGLGKGAGKTTALCAAMARVHSVESVAIFTIGFEGERAEAIKVERGDVVITSATLARPSSAGLEIIEVLPGLSAVGKLSICRVVRGGDVTLVGPEHLSQLAWAIEFVCDKGYTKTILVDGAAGRITQAGALRNCQLVYCARADGADYRGVADKVELVARLADLPLDDFGSVDDNCIFRVDGPLTSGVVDGLHKDITGISIDTFTDCFLDSASFRNVLQRYKVCVRRRISLLGFVVGLKNVSREVFSGLAPSATSKIVFDLFEN